MSSARGPTGIEQKELYSANSFVELMALERLEGTEASHFKASESERIERFRSLAAPYPPGHGNRSFGGHVYAQSAYAASKTVAKEFVVHVRFGQTHNSGTARSLTNR